MRRLAFYLILLPIAVIVLVFAVANRHRVTLSLDPFGAASPSFSLEVPLFLLMFAVLMIGIIIGGVASWFNQARHRKAARRARDEMERYRAETERLRAQLAGATSISQPSLPAPVPF
jgi:uncharacterized integral membrane protein